MFEKHVRRDMATLIQVVMYVCCRRLAQDGCVGISPDTAGIKIMKHLFNFGKQVPNSFSKYIHTNASTAWTHRDVSYPSRSYFQTDRETHSLRYKNYCMTKAMDTDECILRQYRTGLSNTGTDLLTKTTKRTTKPQSRQNDTGTSK